MKRTSFILFLLLFTIIVLSSLHSCYYDREDYLYSSSTTCSDTVYSYTGRIKAIVDQNCAISGCHVGANPEGGIGLENYADVKNNVETGEFLCTITWSSGCSQMPKNSSKLDNCTITAVEQWKAKGYPEN
jgi:hypothetical protein